MTNKDFEKRIGNTMRSYEETPPPELFDRIEKTLAQAEVAPHKTSSTGLVRRITRYASVAAAIAAAFVTLFYFTGRDDESGGLKMAKNTLSTGIDTLSTDPAAETGPNVPPFAPTADRVAQAFGSPSRSAQEAAWRHSIRNDAPNLPRLPHTNSASGKTKPVLSDSADHDRRTVAFINGEGEYSPSDAIILTPPPADAGAETRSDGKDAQREWDRLIAQESRTPKRRTLRRVSAGLYTGNFGSMKGNMDTNDPDRAASDGMVIKQASDKGGSLQSGIHEDNGKPVLAPGQPVTQSVNLHHRMPVNAGLTLAIPLSDRFALKTGLNYSYLYSSSDQAFTAGTAHITRELHYIGIPLAVSYTFYRTRGFEFYAQGGGMAEKAVAWREVKSFSTSEDTSADRLSRKVAGVQFSVNATAGVGYNFNRHLGIYIEPGLTYYFFQKDQPANYRTVHPASFSLRIGLKFGI